MEPNYPQVSFTLRKEELSSNKSFLERLRGPTEQEFSVTSPQRGTMYIYCVGDELDAYVDKNRNGHIAHAQLVRSTEGGAHISSYQATEQYSEKVWHVYDAASKAWLGAYMPIFDSGEGANTLEPRSVKIFGSDGLIASDIECERSGGDIGFVVSLLSKFSTRIRVHGNDVGGVSKPAGQRASIEITGPLGPVDERVLVLAATEMVALLSAQPSRRLAPPRDDVS
jgi:hypothetical protein